MSWAALTAAAEDTMLLRFVRDVEVWLATVKKCSDSEAPSINRYGPLGKSIVPHDAIPLFRRNTCSIDPENLTVNTVQYMRSLLFKRAVNVLKPESNRISIKITEKDK